MLPAGDTMISLNLEIEIIWVSHASKSTGKEVGAIMAGAVCLDYQENNCVATMLYWLECRYSWSTSYYLCHLW